MINIYTADSKEFFIEVIKNLKIIDDNLPLTDTVGIGGEIQFLRLYNKGDISIETIFRFEDFHDVYVKMIER